MFISKDLGENLASLIGMDTSENYIFGYGQDYETVLRSEDDGVTWLAVETSELSKHKSGGSWKNAINVQETTDSSLVQATPSLLYTQSSWGGMLHQGLYSTTILENILSLVLQIFPYLEAFECNTPYGLANQKLCYIQIYKSWRKRQRTFLRVVGIYGP